MAKHVEPLDVWLYDKRLAQLTQIHIRRESTTVWTSPEEALDTYGEGRATRRRWHFPFRATRCSTPRAADCR